MDFELDFSSENSTMTSFLELEQEIREAPLLSEPLVRPSVIVKPRHKPTGQIYHGRQLLKHQYKLSSRSENYLVLVGQFPTVGLKQLYFCFHLHQMDC